MLFRNTPLLTTIMVIFYLVVSIPILKSQSEEVWLTGIIFLFISIIALCSIVKNKKIEENLILIYAFGYYFIYMTMAQLNLLYNQTVYTYDFVRISVLVSVSILLLLIGVKFSLKVKIGYFKFINREVTYVSFFVLLSLALLVDLMQISAAGGFSAYFNSSYQSKFSSVSTEKMFGGISKITAPFAYYNLLFIDDKKSSIVKRISQFYFIYDIIKIFASGASLAILYRLIALCCVKFFDKETQQRTLSKKQKKWLTIGLLSGVVGIVTAILIRFNRNSEGFTFSVLNDAYTLIISTSTFDSLYYMWLTISNLSPQNSFGQFITPLIFWLPRGMFPWKPVELGRLVATTFRNFDSNINGGYAVTPIAEFYFDIGFVGVLIGMLFLGFLLGYLQKKLSGKNNNRRYALVVMLMIMFAASSLATSWISMGSNIVSIFIFLFMANILNRCKVKNRK